MATKVTIDKQLETALNEQIGYEAYSAFLYWSIANWCKKRSLNGSYDFFKKQGDDEFQHMHKIVGFMNDMNANPVMAMNPSNIPQSFNSLYDAIDQSLNHEHVVTQRILDLTDLAYSKKQYNTTSFLDWYNKEQAEEIDIFQDIYDRANILGGNATGKDGTTGVELHELDEYLKDKCG